MSSAVNGVAVWLDGCNRLLTLTLPVRCRCYRWQYIAVIPTRVRWWWRRHLPRQSRCFIVESVGAVRRWLAAWHVALYAVAHHLPSFWCIQQQLTMSHAVPASPDAHLLIAALRTVVRRWLPMADANARGRWSPHRTLSLDLELRRTAPVAVDDASVPGLFLTWTSYRPSVFVAATGVLKYRQHIRTSSVDVVVLQHLFFHCISCIVHWLHLTSHV